MTKLRIANDLSLPPDAVTQTFLVVGKRGSGKSNTAARFVEQLHHARLPFVVLDPVDTWWGLKAKVDGSRGLDVYVFGGRKQDLPLNDTDGALIADVLCEHRVSMVLSVKHLSGRARSRFMVQFAQTLFQKWGGGPLHLVLEEAHELAPQMGGSRTNDTDGDAAMLGAFKRLWKLGRSSGIGGTAVTQRPASLSKDITTQSEILIAHRTIGPQDVKAIGEWVKYHGQHESILADLPTLPTGEAFIWAPEFPEAAPIGLTRTTVLLRETFDSASTPKVGEQRVEPKELAAVDLARLRSKMAATIEKAKQEDPKELRKQLAEKDRRLKELEQAKPVTAQQDVPLLTDADRELLRALQADFATFSEDITAKADAMLSTFAERAKTALDETLKTWTATIDHRRELWARRLDSARVQRLLGKLEQVQTAQRPHRTPAPIQQLSPRITEAAAQNGHLGRCERALLAVLIQRNPKPTSREQLAVLSGYSITSSGFQNALGRLRSSGYVQGLTVTATGLGAIPHLPALPTGDGLIAHWRAQLGRAEAAMLDALVHAYPSGLTREQLAHATGYSQTSSGFQNAVGRLRTLELADKGWPLCASAELFA